MLNHIKILDCLYIVISCYDEFHFLKSNFIDYKDTILTSDAATTLNKNNCVVFLRGLYILADVYWIFRWGEVLTHLELLIKTTISS